MRKLTGAVALSVLAAFMLAGFLQSGGAGGGAAALAALGLTVGLPVAGAVLLVRSHLAERRLGGQRTADLRRQTIESELLRLARLHGGRLTVVEAAAALALPSAELKAVLDAMMLRSEADLEVTEEGVLVYTFHDLRHLPGKATARSVLDA
jgi:hypothetical protein